ncbi:MAG: DinB family protein [Thioalkalivibrio sp.]|nr:DinB family protein [Thioalkalivibrio sp.]
MSDTAWSEAEVLHAATVRRYLATVGSVATDRWAAEPRPPIAFPPLKAWVLRTFVLPRLLKGRPFPPGVKAPREVRPKGDMSGREVLAAEFERAAGRFLAAYQSARQRPGAKATHPYFGRLALSDMFRFASIHTEHHRRQLEWAASAAQQMER